MEKFIKNNYPDAVEGKRLTRQLTDRLVKEYNFDLDKTLMATSVCSDEIIRSATNFREYLNHRNPFQLGGLGGYPFSGLTGLAAFAAHLPDDGYALILYGPHIGVSKNGEVGTIQRHGQVLETSCCGALQATLSAFQEDGKPTADAELDYQLWKIGKELLPYQNSGPGKPSPLASITEQMFDVIDRRIQLLIETSGDTLKGRQVALIGGIIINTDADLPDWFDLRRFDVIR